MRSGRALPSVASMSNQIAVITGASRGLGRALAAGLAREGYALIIDARNAAALEAATVAIWDAGGTVTAIPGDVTDPAHRAALLRAVDQAGTTVVRALETSALRTGAAEPSAGWTSYVVTPETGVTVADGLLTGLHEPRSSHLRMLAAFAGPELLSRCYEAAIASGYLWHEFGDVHLLLP